MTDLRRHVPRIALDWDDDAPGQAWQRVDATLVFADISGFTALTERLARRGRIGAEELIETLNRVFGAMLGMAALRGGELLKFGGDALLFTFRGPDHAVRACAAAVDMRAALREAAAIPTSVGRLRLRMSVGIHSGPVDFFLVGHPTRELLILGPSATATAQAEKLADAGQIVVSPDTALRLPRNATRARDDGALLLRWRSAAPPASAADPVRVVDAERLRSLFPRALGDYLADRVPDPEHRIATIGFARFSGTDTLLSGPGPQAVAEALQETVTVFMAAMNGEGVTLLATDLDSDGGKFFMGSGVPNSSEDDEGRMLRAMRFVLEKGTPLPVQVGVNRGHVFAAEVGTLDRAAYSAMGDTTNTAARIMSKAPHGVLFAHPSVLERSRTLFATQPAGPFEMKGKAVPVLVHDVGEELGTRAAEGESRLPLLGRDDEVASIRAAVARGLSGEGSVVVVSGATGTGKSRVVAEALTEFDVRTIVVRAEPYGATSPYRVLRDPVRSLLGVERGTHEEMADAVRAGVRRLAPELLEYAPLLGDVVSVTIPETPESRAVEPKFRPDRIADLVVRLVETTFPGPLLLRVEEGHWADAASSHILARFAAETSGRPWAMLVTRRDEGGFAPEGSTVALEPLSDNVIRKLVIAATEAAPMRPHEVDDVVRRAQGNPLFVEEITRAFQELGSLEAVPDNLHAALDAQIDALDPHARRILRYCSVLGRSFRRDVINEVLRAGELVVDAATLEELREFLEPDGEDRLRFRNSMIRDAAYDGLAYRMRARLHAAAGAAVERLSEDLEADADILSLHYWTSGNAEKTWRYARMAGDRAARAFANAEAVAHYQRAWEAARDIPTLTDADRLDLLRRLARARGYAGMFDAAARTFTECIAITPESESCERADLMQRRAHVRFLAGAHRVGLRDISTALRLLDADTSTEATNTRVRLRSLRVVIRFEQARLADARDEAAELVGLARGTEEREALAQALTVHDSARFQLGDTTVGAGLSEAVDICLANGFYERAARAQMNLGIIAQVAGRWDDAVRYYEGAIASANAAGDNVSGCYSAINLSEILTFRGALDEADEILRDSVRTLRVAGVPTWAAYGDLNRARILLARGHLAEAEEAARAVEDEVATKDQPLTRMDAMIVRAEAMSRDGRPAEALVVLEAAAGVEDRDTVWLQPRRHLERARALLALGDVLEARSAAVTGIDVAREKDIPHEEARLLELLSELEQRLGAPDAARAAAEEAEAILRRLGAA